MNLKEHIKLQERLYSQNWLNMSVEERKKQSLKNLKFYLQNIDPLELQKRIDKFRKLNFNKLSYSEIGKAVNDTISVKIQGGKLSYSTWINSGLSSYPVGTRFYRVRAIPKNDRQLPLRSMSKVSDCWEPPEEIVEIGRLNKAKQPVLYTTPSSPIVAIEEKKISNNEFFSLIVYEATQKINVAMIGQNFEYNGLNKEEILKLQMIQDFFYHEFIRDVGKGTEYLYRISEYITKTFFDFPSDFQDAWCYPSITRKENYNVCFRPVKRKEKLKLIGVQIARVCKKDNQKVVRTYLVAGQSSESLNLSYFKMGSPEQQKLFPELNIKIININQNL